MISLGSYILTLLMTVSIPANTEIGKSCSVPQVVDSPCSGILLPTGAAEEALRCLRIDKPKLKLKLQYQNDLFENQRKYYELILAAEMDRSEDLSTQIDKLIGKPVPHKAIFENTVFWTVVGVFIGAGSAVAIAYSLPRR
jgi:hypothetical protein